MPPKINIDATVMFLCSIIDLQNRINWQEVGEPLGLAPNTAYMRYKRIKDAIGKESGTTPTATPTKKRKPEAGDEDEGGLASSPTTPKSKKLNGQATQKKRGRSTKSTVKKEDNSSPSEQDNLGVDSEENDENDE